MLTTDRPSSNVASDSSVAPNRFWTAPDGTLWRVWLEPPARHRLRQGETRPVLAFVEMGVELSRQRKVNVAVGEGTRLEAVSEEELCRTLGRREGAQAVGPGTRCL